MRWHKVITYGELPFQIECRHGVDVMLHNDILEALWKKFRYA